MKGVSLANRPTEPGRTPLQLVEDAVFIFAQAVQKEGADLRHPDTLRGFVGAFLMEYPIIHNAVVASQLVERMMHGCAGFLGDAADYVAALKDYEPTPEEKAAWDAENADSRRQEQIEGDERQDIDGRG